MSHGKGEAFRVNSNDTFENMVEWAREKYRKHGYVVFTCEAGSTRSDQQNRALHLWCEQLATALNDAGFDMVILLQALSKKTEVPWTKTSVKERLWKPVQIAMTEKKSTTEPRRAEYPEIYEALTRIIANTAPGVHVPWPTIERG